MSSITLRRYRAVVMLSSSSLMRVHCDKMAEARSCGCHSGILHGKLDNRIQVELKQE